MGVNIIGISALYHDAACCLLQNGRLIAAAEEERFTRIKADPSMPVNALKYCLEEAGLDLPDIDCIAYYEQPGLKLARQLWSGVLGNEPGLLQKIKPDKVEWQIRHLLGYEGTVKYFNHHQSHAASSFFFSGFDEAAIFTVDGVGEWATTTYGAGRGTKLEVLEEVAFPDSLGLLYSTITSYLGFGVNDGEYKVMGLAPYGRPVYVDAIRRLICNGQNGQYQLNLEYFSFLREDRMYSDLFIELFGQPPRKEDDAMEQFHKDVAKSMQVVLEETLVEKANYLYSITGMDNLCMAGGVALNCVANGQVLKKSRFKKLFVQPAANDAGGALGAAALAHIEITSQWPAHKKLDHVYLGPSYSSDPITKLLQSTSVQYKNYSDDETGLLNITAKKISEGKVIGWFQHRMEFGPRSLGARSILADPRNPTMRDRINAMVKKREGFRPFAPAVLASKAQEHFDLDHPSPFMLETCQVISSLHMPAITHVDGSARVQTVDRQANERFFDLISAFDSITGCPVLLNTSFNIKGQPIVCSPEDALICFITTDIDCLVMGNFFIDREENDLELLRIILAFENVKPSKIVRDVYTFI
jgi:carbamoyltransferase